MTLTFSSLEEAWGGKSTRNDTKQRTNLITNASKKTTDTVHSTTFNISPSKQQNQYTGPSVKDVSTPSSDKYENIYCNTIINHVQACPYCQEKLRHILGINNTKCVEVKENKQDTVYMKPDVLSRNNDNLAYVPFGLEPEVFNILLFSVILISLIFLIDKKGLKSFKF